MHPLRRPYAAAAASIVMTSLVIAAGSFASKQQPAAIGHATTATRTAELEIPMLPPVTIIGKRSSLTDATEPARKNRDKESQKPLR